MARACPLSLGAARVDQRLTNPRPPSKLRIVPLGGVDCGDGDDMSNPTPTLALGIIIAYTAAAAISIASAEPPATPTAATASAETVKEEPAAEVKFQPPSGYEKRLRKGQEVYCRSIVPLGSRIKRTECFSEAQLAAIEEAQRAYREDMRNQSLICADERCSGS